MPGIAFGDFLREDWNREIARMNPEQSRQLNDFEDLIGRCPFLERILDMPSNAGRVQVSCGGVDGDKDQFLKLRRQRPVPDWDVSQREVSLQKIWIPIVQQGPQRIPVVGGTLEVRDRRLRFRFAGHVRCRLLKLYRLRSA